MLSGRPSTCSASTLESRRWHSERAADDAAMLRFSTASSGVRRMSEAIAAMQGDDAAAEIVILAVLEPRLAHHREQRILRREAPDRLGEIAIARLVLRDDLA